MILHVRRTLTSTVFLCVAALAAPAGASTMLVDVGHQTAANGTGGVTASPDVNGNYWSTLSATGAPLNLVNKASGALTGATLTLTTGGGQGAGFTGNGFLNTTPAPGDLNVASAYGDAWFDNVSGGSATGTFTYGGLNPALIYELTLWGSRDSSWSNGAVNVTTGLAQGGPNFALLQATPLTLTITPSAGGQFAFVFDDTNSVNSDSAVLNVMRLVATPEPSSLALWAALSLAALALSGRRRPRIHALRILGEVLR